MTVFKKTEKNYAAFYNSLTAKIRRQPQKIRLLNQLNTFLTRLIYLTYPLLLLAVLWQKDYPFLPFVLIPALSFAGVSLLRRIINLPRPYEAWEIDPLISKDTKGQSMPSRHVFSAAIISMSVLRLYIWLGLLYLILSLLLACCRVLGGVHYPKDVIVGYALGLLYGLLLFL
ncbi:phosphatase PAP2 family protein [Streptococcus sp. H49]|uniref:phosphatase PAP2 family protein n=1 Tax=Streptococcus huangxiaojuni TaxID=3237239 RepID=UPI0034A37818